MEPTTEAIELRLEVGARKKDGDAEEGGGQLR
jgi:hypothetical protein